MDATAVRMISERDGLVHSYLYLRRAIGLLGMTLPVVLIIGNLLLDDSTDTLRKSISGYYYSDMRDIYVGAMCAMGVFLLSYRGYTRVDDVGANIAGLAAIGVALFPTTPASTAVAEVTTAHRAAGVVHTVAAVVFFLTLAFFCLVLFRRSAKDSPRKLWRDRIYVTSGLILLTSLTLVLLTALFPTPAIEALRPVLWLESAATLAFGIAWAVKGQAILGDLPDEL
jgi:hypothetical protein